MFLVALVFSFLFLFLLFLFLFLLLVFNIPEIKQREWVRLQKNCLRSASFESRRGPNLLVSKSSSDVLRQRPAVCRHKVSSNVHLIPNVPRNLEAPHQHLQLIICQWCVSLQSDENDFVYQVISSPAKHPDFAVWLRALPQSVAWCSTVLVPGHTHIGLESRVHFGCQCHERSIFNNTISCKAKRDVKISAVSVATLHRYRQDISTNNKIVGIMALSHANVSWDSQNWWEIHGNSKSPLRFWVPHHMTKIISSIFILWSFRVMDCCLRWLVL